MTSIEQLGSILEDLMLVPGLSGYEDRVRRSIAAHLSGFGLASRCDRLGNLIATLDGDPEAPSVMLFAHTDQLGFVVRKIEARGLVRIERLGGVPEKALPSLPVLFCVGEGRDRPGIFANKSHHATPPEEKYKVVPYADLFIDAGVDDAASVRAMGIEIGTPVVYEPRVLRLSPTRIAGLRSTTGPAVPW